MIALLVGLLIVAVGAAGTYVVLFHRHPAKVSTSTLRRPIGPSAVAEPPPRNTRRGGTVGPTRRAAYDPSPDIRTSPSRRLMSGLVLLLITLGVALSIGATLSAFLVVLITILS